MKKQTKRKNSLPAYKKPPVIEVVCGIAFKKIAQFKAPHLGLFWQKLRADYPTCQHAPPLGFPPDPSEATDGFELPLPRIWFISEKKNGLIQLQNNRFFYNWRKLQADEPYPHYQVVIKNFKASLNMFQKFLNQEKLGSLYPTECELTYINDISKGEGWETISDIPDILPDISWRSKKSRFLPEPLHIGWQALFALPEDKGRLHVKLDQVAHKIDKRPILRIEISAKGLGADRSQKAIWDWFEIAHKWIVCGFTDLTSSKIQNAIWERSDGTK
ncbi:MAG: TIGR04255 family protein [Desulfobacterales bacterium]|nr:TIGR04255 family protein [Desulfobacterales bacterium]